MGYNSAEQENYVLCIFNFQGPSRTQKDLGFFEDYFSRKANTWSTRTSRADPGGPKEPRWRSPVGGPRHPPSFGRWSVNTETPKQRQNQEDWRGKRRRSHPRLDLHPLQHHHQRLHDEEGAVHLWTIGFSSSLIYLSLMLLLFKNHMSCLT